LCKNRNAIIGQFQYESEDATRLIKNKNPAFLKRADGYFNKMNQYQDSVWIGSYLSLRRMNRFPAVMEANRTYEVSYSANPPMDTSFELLDIYAPYGITVNVQYVTPEIHDIMLEFVENQPKSQWRKIYKNPMQNTGLPLPVSGRYCGENLWNPKTMRLTMYLDGKNSQHFQICRLHVVTLNAIMGILQLEIPLAEFWSGGHMSTFQDHMAAQLGIQPWRMRTVGTFSGSTVVHFFVTENVNTSAGSPSTTSSMSELSAVLTNLRTKASSNSLGFGFNILSFSASLSGPAAQSTTTAKTSAVTVSGQTVTKLGITMIFVVIIIIPIVIAIIVRLTCCRRVPSKVPSSIEPDVIDDGRKDYGAMNMASDISMEDGGKKVAAKQT